MKKSPRRKFVKQFTTVAAAIGSLGIESTGEASEKSKSGTADMDILYHETSEWKRYYETLK